MPRPKRQEQTFQLVQRSLHDPRGFGQDAKGVFVEVDKGSKTVTREQLEKDVDQFKRAGRRDNEGEAALYGIPFDDSQYDYMQHFKEIGQHPDAIFIGADGSVSQSYRPAEAGQRLMLADLLNEGATPKKLTFKEHYQAMLPVQDSISGPQPDMDPQLAEVLDALEDDAFVDDPDEDLFAELVNTGEVSAKEWQSLQKKDELKQKPDEEDWEFAFRKFKLEDSHAPPASSSSEAEEERAADDESRDALAALPKVKKPKKKRIGAKTDLTGFSMSSSANYRNAGLSLVDDAFEKVEAEYGEEVEEEQGAFDISKERSDFNSIMDEFLDGYVLEGKRLYKK